jgi:O-acetyl-ADP-ribose deacetylase (regulator of RNase III)
VQFVPVEQDVWVANMIGQRDIRRARKPVPVPPVRYEAIEAALRRIAAFARERGASVHMPRIGCGLAGGTWDRMEPIVRAAVVDSGVEAYVYDLPEQPGKTP